MHSLVPDVPGGARASAAVDRVHDDGAGGGRDRLRAAARAVRHAAAGRAPGRAPRRARARLPHRELQRDGLQPSPSEQQDGPLLHHRRGDPVAVHLPAGGGRGPDGDRHARDPLRRRQRRQ